MLTQNWQSNAGHRRKAAKTLPDGWVIDGQTYRHSTGAFLVEEPSQKATPLGTSRPWTVMVAEDTSMLDDRERMRRFADPGKAMEAFNKSKYNYPLSQLADFVRDVSRHLPGEWTIDRSDKDGFVRIVEIVYGEWRLRFEIRMNEGSITLVGNSVFRDVKFSMQSAIVTIAETIRQQCQIGDQEKLF